MDNFKTKQNIDGLSGEITIPPDKSISHRAIIFGALTKVDIVWNLADLFMSFMAIVNLIAILLLGKFAFRALKNYTDQKKQGIENPTFKSSDIEGLTNADEWK